MKSELYLFFSAEIDIFILRWLPNWKQFSFHFKSGHLRLVGTSGEVKELSNQPEAEENVGITQPEVEENANLM